MKFLAVTFLLAAPTRAFTFQRRTVSLSPLRTSTTTTSHPRKPYGLNVQKTTPSLVADQESMVVTPEIAAALVSPPPNTLEPPLANPSAVPVVLEIDPDKTVDAGKEIFLASLEENGKLVEETHFDVDRSIQQDLSLARESAYLEAGTRNTNNLNLDQLADTAVDIVQGADVAAAVGVVLSASNEALKAAEEKLVTDRRLISPAVDTSVSTSITAPTVGKILKFAIPAIGVWLCNPLLSLIDTSCVGLLSGTSQQAALNPAVAVTDYTALLIAFLYTGTTNLIAAAREKDRTVQGMPRTTKTFVGALQFSMLVGTALGAVLFVFANPLLRTIIGNDSISPEVFSAAMKYVRIRALGMPAAAVIGSAQAACLGMQDIRSPLYVLGLAAVVNFMGDMLFVGNTHPWIGGAAGAAWATTFSQFAAVGLFLHWLCHKPKPKPKLTLVQPFGAGLPPSPPSEAVNVSRAILELTGKTKSRFGSTRQQQTFRDTVRSFYKTKATQAKKSKASETQEDFFSVRGFLEKRFRTRDLFKPPSKATIQEFAEYVLPVTTTQVGRVSGYVAMSHVVSSSLGTLSMAAQQIIVSLFYCLTPIADSLSLTAQSFLPSISEREPSQQRSKALAKTTWNFAKAGAIFGAVMVSTVSSVPWLTRFFTADPQVMALVSAVTPLLFGVFAVHGMICAMEGVLMGRKDLGFLGKMYASFFAVVPYCMLRVKYAALAGDPRIGLHSVWKVFLGYQLVRTAVWSLRAAVLQHRTEQESNHNAATAATAVHFVGLPVPVAATTGTTIPK